MSYDKYSAMSAKMTINSIEEFLKMAEGPPLNPATCETLFDAIKNPIKIHKDTLIELEANNGSVVLS